jgi:hypothetical protein
LLGKLINLNFEIFCKKLELGKLKNPISALRKWKTHFSWEEMKIGLRGIPRHPKGHACVRYGLVLTNYDMIRAKSSSFDLKAMQPRMW